MAKPMYRCGKSYMALMLLLSSLSPLSSAAELEAPTQVVSQDLENLVNGNTRELIQLIGGRMKHINRQLIVSRDSYSDFLRSHYTGVRTTIEDLNSNGDKVLARVRFDYPSGDTNTVVFVVTESNGIWKIIDEIY